uniref:PAS domain-containing protein n=1 Tax=Lepeophtheirus salmonis TaxID=72036 RepID=A0A0K2U7I9_LEPSM
MWQGHIDIPIGLALDINASDGLVLNVSKDLGSLLGLGHEDRVSIYQLLHGDESWRLMNSLFKGVVEAEAGIYRFRCSGSHSGEKKICLEVCKCERRESGSFRIWLKNHHSGPFGIHESLKGDEILHGFSILLHANSLKIQQVSYNFKPLLGHTTHLVETSFYKWIHPEDQNCFSNLKKLTPKESIRFRASNGTYEHFTLSNLHEVTKETFKMNFKVFRRMEEEERIFSTLLTNEFRVREVCCNNHVPLPYLTNRNFLELISSPDDLHYLENRMRKKVPGLTRLYEIRINPKRILFIQTNFFFYPNNEILAHHFIVKDKEERSPQTFNQNNNVLKRKLLSGEEEEDSTTQKNKLLRELLNVNYSIHESNNTSSTSSSLSPTSSSSNSRILQLLNSKSSDLGGRRKTPPSVAKSFMCSQNPALADLLSKPPYHASTAVPPPVPTKWHQEPREKLPRDIMRKYLPPHPAERSKLNTESHNTVNNTRSCTDTDHDPMLSEILDGVIDIQEKTPGSSRDIVQKRINLSDIEKFLSAAEAQQSVPTNHLYSSMVRNSSVGSNSVPRMNELLQVIPPNVTIPPNSVTDHSPNVLNVMSQRRPSIQSSRNISSNYDPTFTTSSNFSTNNLPQSPQQHLIMPQQHPHQQPRPPQQPQQMNSELQEGSTSSMSPKGGSLLLQLLSE